MSFLLQNLEIHVDEADLLLGERLLEEDGVKQIQEVERHLWISNVKDQEIYEVEIKISPSKIISTTCECPKHQQKNICEHVVATLLLVRRKRSEKNIARRKSLKPPKSRKLTPNLILEQVPIEDLKAFIKQYAKNDRNFSLALKARFAAHVENIDTKEKYLQLLDSTINTSRKADRTFSHRGAVQIVKMLQELENQIQDHFARENYLEAISLTQSIIEKITPILKKISDEKYQLRAKIEAAFRLILEVAQSNAAPALKETIWDYCVQELDKRTYRSNQLDLLFFEILSEIAKSKNQVDIISDLFKENIAKHQKEQLHPISSILANLQFLERFKRKRAFNQLINENLNHPDILKYTIEQAIGNGNFTQAKKMARLGIKAQKQKSNAFFTEILYQIALKEKDKENIIRFGLERLKATFDIKYFTNIRDAYNGDWHNQFNVILNQIRQQPYSIAKRNLIATLLLQEKQELALVNYLEEIQSLDLLQQFDEYLLPKYKKQLFALYQTLLHRYLKNHLGPIPSAKIKNTIFHLYEINAEKLANQLAEEIRATYPERHSLMEELALF